MTTRPPIRVHPSFAEELMDISKKRWVANLDKRPPTPARLTLAIKRHPQWPNIKKDLTNWPFMKDNKAQMQTFNIFTFMIVGFMAVLLFAGLIYVMGLINDVFHTVGLQNEANAGKPGYTNMTLAADNTFGKVNSSIKGLRLVAFSLIFSLIVGNILVNALVKVHPAFFFVYVLIVMLAVFLAVPISNAYENILNSGIYNNELFNFTGSNWILLHLPPIVTVLGLLGGVFMFINIVRAGNDGLDRGLS